MVIKEIVERRNGQPIEFLFLPNMGLLGNQAGIKKKLVVVNYEQLLRVVFSCFDGQKLNFFKFFLHCSIRTKKLLDTNVIFIYFF